MLETVRAIPLEEEGASLTFAARLARENGWSKNYSRRVVEEYRRFVALAMTAGHPVTPSDEVDQAWHLHLTYSRSYAAMNQVLPAPLHHGPTKGGKAEDQKFQNWYEKTKDAYRLAFGQEPPPDIWPSSQERFGRAPHFRRVNVQENWVVPKASVQRTAVWSGMALAALSLAGCSAWVAAQSSGPPRGFDQLIGIFAIVGAAAVGLGLLVLFARRGGNRSSQSGCSTTGHYYSTPGFGSDDQGRSHDSDPRADSDNAGSDGSGSDSSSSDSGSSDSGGSTGCSSSGCGGGGCSS